MTLVQVVDTNLDLIYFLNLAGFARLSFLQRICGHASLMYL